MAAFPGEIIRPPREWAARVCNLQRWTPMAAGGHFAALEEPQALVEDIRAFARYFCAMALGREKDSALALAFHDLRELKTEGEVGEDDEKRAEAELQKLTDERVHELDGLLKQKEAEILEV